MKNTKPSSENCSVTCIGYMYTRILVDLNTKYEMVSESAFAILSPAIITETVRLLSIAAPQKRQQRQPTNMNDLLAASSRIEKQVTTGTGTRSTCTGVTEY